MMHDVEDEVDDAQPDDESAEPAEVHPDPERKATARAVVPWAIAVALALVCLALGVVAAGSQSDARQERHDRDEIADTASRLATAISTYDHRSFGVSKRRVLELSTGAFHKEYEDGASAIAELAGKAQAVSEAAVKDVFLSDVDEGRARAIVVLDIRATGLGGPRVQLDNYVDLSLVKVEGRWLVDGVQNLNFGVPAAAPSTTAKP